MDGLRAIAVGVVLAYHLLPGVLPGGMVGVDVFFVISGFLITTLLVDERRRTGRTDFLRFWRRRLRRIVPALVVAVAVVVSMAVALGGDILLGVRRQVLGGVFLAYNWVEILHGSSYFDKQPLLLTNVWSLAVEEQFYVVWPLVLVGLLLLARGRRGLAAVASLVLALASFGEALWLSGAGASASRIYMGTDTHAFGLMLGAALALVHGRALQGDLSPSAVPVRYLRGVLGWLGLAGIVVCARLADDGAGGATPAQTTMWLAASSLCAVAVLQGLTSEVLGAAGPARVMAWVLDLPLLTWIGTRSYGLYLWHWPLYVVAFYAASTPDNPTTTGPVANALIVLFLTVVATELSYRFLETPIRRKGVIASLKALPRVGPRGWLAAATCSAVVVAMVSGAFAAEPRMSTSEQAIRDAEQMASAAASAVASAEAAASAAPATPSAPSTMSPREQAQAAVAAGTAAVGGDQIEVVGDSVALGAQPALITLFPGIAVDAAVSRSSTKFGEGLAAVEAGGGQRPYVVVALATNSAITSADLDQMLAQVGDRKLVLVTGYGPPRCTWIPPTNEAIRSFAQAHPTQVAVADWEAAVTDRPDLLAGDRVHPAGQEGIDLFASTINQAVASLVE